MASPLTLTPTSNDSAIGYESHTTFADLLSASTGSAIEKTETTINVATGSYTGWTYWRNYRGVVIWDTSSIPTDATITGAVVRVYMNSLSGSGAHKFARLVESTIADMANPVVADYDQFGSVNMATADVTNDTAGWKELTLTSTGLSKINSAGLTQFGFKHGHDIDAYDAGQQNGLFVFTFQSSEGTNPPQLVITYTQPSAGFFALL